MCSIGNSNNVRKVLTLHGHYNQLECLNVITFNRFCRYKQFYNQITMYTECLSLGRVL